MGNQFYVPGEPRASRVRDLFGTIAPRYDLINDLQSLGLHRRWKRRVLQLAGLRPGERALDVCCGTGDLALAMARIGLAVVGLDFSDRMLAVARERQCKETGAGSEANGLRPEDANQPPNRADQEQLRKPRLTRDQSRDWTGDRPAVASLVFVRGDALRIPFHNEQFDVATIGYGLRNLSDCVAGLQELNRVLKPGGRMLVLDFGKPSNAVWRAFYFAYLRVLVPLFGRVFCGDSATYAYINESLRHYPAQEGVAALMRGMDFTQVRVVNLLGGVMSIHCAVKSSLKGSCPP